VDLFVSIQLNCFNGQGYRTEVFTWEGEQFRETTRVLINLVGLGYANRGIKDGSNLYVIKNTKAKAMLIECCFCDSKEDMNKYDAEKIANAIVEGITGKTVSNNIEANKGEYDIEKIVTYLGDADVFAAIMVSQKHRCPLMKYEDFKNLNTKAKEVITVGGTNCTVIGNNRFETFKNAVKLL
jgi:N-acetylmuramoyl-L-alanine amidase